MGRKKKFAIAEYSAMAISLLGTNEISAQAVYVDIEPDFVLDEPLEWYFLDLDSNGISDFQFINNSATYSYSYYHQSTSFRQVLLAGIWGTYANNIAARFASMTFGPDFFFPYAIESGIEINKYFSFGNWIYQEMAIRTYESVTISSNIYYLTGEGGKWFPPIEDKYLGIQFKAEDEKMHFGWIRCSVIDEHEEGLTLIIKDYAYESKPNVPIIAGDTIGDTTKFVLEAEEIHELYANIYSFQKTIYCIINHEDMNAELFIYSISGEKIVTQKLTAEKTEIDFSKYASGVYVVEIMSGEHKCIKKVLVE